MRYLQEKQYYIDRYDLHTIEECLSWYFDLKEGMEKKRSEIKKITKEEFDKDVHKAVSYTVNVITIQRYRYKAETIKSLKGFSPQLTL